MILSHTHNFIFIKTHKTAGSSVEVALEGICGPQDVVTPMKTDDGGETESRNYHGQSRMSTLYAKNKFVRKFISRTSNLVAPYFWEHMPAHRVRDLMGSSEFDQYFSFCFERNPWEKVVSYYQWKTIGQGRKLDSFRNWIQHKPHRLPKDGKLWSDGGQQIVSCVLDHRNVEEKLQEVLKEIGAPSIGSLPREKTRSGRSRGDYRDWYDQDTKDAVAQHFAFEIETMGYRFEDPEPDRPIVRRS